MPTDPTPGTFVAYHGSLSDRDHEIRVVVLPESMAIDMTRFLKGSEDQRKLGIVMSLGWEHVHTMENGTKLVFRRPLVRNKKIEGNIKAHHDLFDDMYKPGSS